MNDLSGEIVEQRTIKPIALFEAPSVQGVAAEAKTPSFGEQATHLFTVVGLKLQVWSVARHERKIEKQKAHYRNLTETERRQEFAQARSCGCGGAANCNYCGHLVLDMGLAGTRQD